MRNFESSSFENTHPEAVTERINEIAIILESARDEDRDTSFRFHISNENLRSVIKIEEGKLDEVIIRSIIALTLGDNTTTTEIDGATNTISVSLNRLN